jgi:hypothetical protein
MKSDRGAKQPAPDARVHVSDGVDPAVELEPVDLVAVGRPAGHVVVLQHQHPHPALLREGAEAMESPPMPVPMTMASGFSSSFAGLEYRCFAGLADVM